jgi:hypothetical protein
MTVHAMLIVELPDQLIASVRERLNGADAGQSLTGWKHQIGAVAGISDLNRAMVRSVIASACATVTIGCDQSDAVDSTDTVTIAGVALAVVASPSTTAQFAKGADDIEFAANLVAAIHANATLAKLVRASSDGIDTVTVTALAPGPVGNFLTLAETGNGFTISGAVFSGGASDAPQTYERGYTPAV